MRRLAIILDDGPWPIRHTKARIPVKTKPFHVVPAAKLGADLAEKEKTRPWGYLAADQHFFGDTKKLCASGLNQRQR